jgi:BASS family bile acid:Na+ symporter
MLQRWLLAWLSAFALLAFLWPEGSWDPFSATRPHLKLIFAVPMFALGWLLPKDELRQVGRAWPLVVGGTFVQFATMPLLAWIASRTFPLSDDQRLGLILVGCVPGAMASNVLTLLARGNVSYSLSLTTSATCLSPFFVPLVLKLALGTELTTPLSNLVIELIWMVLIPVVAGFLLGSRFSAWKEATESFSKNLAAFAIIWIIAVVVRASATAIADASWPILLSVLVLNLAGYCAGWGGAIALRLNEPMRRALVLEIGMQNAGLGATLAASLFQDRPGTMIAPALYTFGCMLTGTLLARWWAGRTLDTLES